MKISLLGQFGSGNSGNDGSLEAMLIYLRRLQPDAELVCICSNPALIATRYKIRTMSVGGPPLSSRWARTVDRILLKLPRRLALFFIAAMQLNSFDVMIIPGTGILDDFQERAFGWPFVIFCWCLVARLCGTRIAFVSIGAGPIKGRLSRWFLRSAAKMASYRSYRDDYSLDFMRKLGIDVSKDRRYPDIAFSLPTPYPEKDQHVANGLSVAVGIMNYRGWRANDPQSEAIYQEYLGKISTFVCWLVRKGFRVRLAMGDTTDRSAMDDVSLRLAKTLGAEDLSRIEIGLAGSLHDIMTLMSTVDIAIVSRYHNLVCSLKLDRPTISLGYARKNDDLMRDFNQERYCFHIETFSVLVEIPHEIVVFPGIAKRYGRKNDDLMRDFNQERYCFHIETFSVDALKTTFDELLDNRIAIQPQIRQVNEDWKNQLLEQQLLLRERLLTRKYL